MRKSRLFSILLLFFTFLFISCSDIFEARQGVITVNLPSSGARASYGQSDITHYKMQITNDHEEIVQETTVRATSATLTSKPLEDGVYYVYIAALRNGTQIGSGFSTNAAIIENGKSTPVEVKLTMIDVPSFTFDGISVSENNAAIIPASIDNTNTYYIVEKSKTYTISSNISGGLEPFSYTWIPVESASNNNSSLTKTFDAAGQIMYMCTVKDSKNSVVTSPSCTLLCPELSITSSTVSGSKATVNISTGCGLPSGKIHIFDGSVELGTVETSSFHSVYTYTTDELSTGNHTISINYQYTDVNSVAHTVTGPSTTVTIPESGTPDPEPVTQSEFYVSLDGSTNPDGTSSKPFPTLSQALTKINSETSLTEATIYLIGDCTFSNSGETAYFTIEKNITIKPSNESSTIFVYENNNYLWIAQSGSLTLDGNNYTLTIKSGIDNGQTEPNTLTSALFTVNGGQLNILHNTYLNSIKSSNALINVQSSGNLKVSDSYITNNTCETVLSVNSSTANLETGMISTNTCTATSSNGAILAKSNAEINIGQTSDATKDFKITSNSAISAGAIYTDNAQTTSPTINILSNVAIQNNYCTDSNSAGGIYIINRSAVNITGSNIKIDSNKQGSATGTEVNFYKPTDGTGVLTVDGTIQNPLPTSINL